MRAIELTIEVRSGGTAMVQFPPDVPLGEYQVMLVLEEGGKGANQRLKRSPKPPLNLVARPWDGWPTDSTFRREDIHGDDGR